MFDLLEYVTVGTAVEAESTTLKFLLQVSFQFYL